jgi:hypothetical protein
VSTTTRQMTGWGWGADGGSARGAQKQDGKNCPKADHRHHAWAVSYGIKTVVHNFVITSWVQDPVETPHANAGSKTWQLRSHLATG